MNEREGELRNTDVTCYIVPNAHESIITRFGDVTRNLKCCIALNDTSYWRDTKLQMKHSKVMQWLMLNDFVVFY